MKQGYYSVNQFMLALIHHLLILSAFIVCVNPLSTILLASFQVAYADV